MRGYRVPPPAPGDLIAWPDAFGTRFAIGVDTEEEFDWRIAPSQAQRSVSAIAALPAAHRRFAERGIDVTYLVDHPVVADPGAVATLREVLAIGRAAIGTQLHPWVNPPFDAASAAESFPGNLPRELQAAKLDTLTDAITAAFGAFPRVFRAGRYGVGPDTFDLLAERGYRLDSSMRAAYSYADQGGPDFRAVGNHAFRCGPGGALIELPLTTVFTGAARALGVGLDRVAAGVPRGRGLLARAGLLSRVALSPEDMPVSEALEAVRIAIGERVRVLNFAFHSPSLVPGHTPYVRDAADLARFHRWWDRMLDLLDRMDATPVSFDAVIAAADAAPPLASPSAPPLGR